MLYNFKEIENKWQKFWAENNTFKAQNNSKLPKFYILDMVPTVGDMLCVQPEL